MKKANSIAAVVLIGIALLVLFEAADLPYSTEIGPGAAFFPIWLSGLLIFASLLLALQSVRMDASADQPIEWLRIRRPASICAVLLVWILGLERLGFLVSTTIAIAVLLIVLERYSAIRGVIIAAVGSVVLYVVFDIMLGVPLPLGYLFT